jgi:hypothetical protein
MLEATTMLEVGVLLLLAIPIVAWVVIHKRADGASDPAAGDDEGPRHRWWQP